jgi:acetyl-CoA acetyltransferase
VNKNKLEIKVSAEFKEGKVLVLNVEKNVFEVKNSQKVMVKFDGKEIPEGEVEDVIMGNSTQAKYAKALGEDGGQYILYIPHFSEHVITIETVGITGSQSSNLILGSIAAAMITILILGIVVVNISKNKNS